MRRIQQMIEERGRILMCASEAINGTDATDDTVLMAWKDTEHALQAARSGHQTVMSVMHYNYFDMAYPEREERKGNGCAGRIDSRRAYEWDEKWVWNTAIVEEMTLLKNGNPVVIKKPDLHVKCSGSAIDLNLENYQEGADYQMNLKMRNDQKNNGRTGGKITIDCSSAATPCG